MTNIDKTMNENEYEAVDSINDADETVNEEVDSETTEETTEQSNEELETLRKEVETLRNQKDHWKKKASKPSEPSQKKEAGSEPQLSVKDSIALAKADINVDDIDDVLEFAKFKNMSVSDALNNNMVKAMLKDKEETRRTAQATSTKDGRRAPKQVSSDELLSNARKGNLPQDDNDIARMVEARLEAKKNK